MNIRLLGLVGNWGLDLLGSEFEKEKKIPKIKHGARWMAQVKGDVDFYHAGEKVGWQGQEEKLSGKKRKTQVKRRLSK